jgi:DNA-binding NarL/FixJ family response regulator
MSLTTIFLADDHTVVRDGLRALLENQPDFKVIGDAGDGREAVRQISQLQPDVALLDIAMPELNGIEATRSIGECCPATQVIMLSMHETGGHIERALRAGARGYVLKSSVGAEVVEAIRLVRAGHRYLSPKVSDLVIDHYLDRTEPETASDPLSRLTPREREVLQLVVEGRPSAEIAEALYLAPATVDSYRSRLMQKLEIADLATLVKFAIRHGLTPLD